MTVFALIRRVLGVPVVLLLAVLLQLVLVNRLPLPGGGAPDLVLLVVTAIGATAGPLAGTIAGFCGGLALDIAPPSGHLAGEYALVFCLAGYACGRLRTLGDPEAEHSALMSLAVMAIGVAGGEAATAGLGRMLSDQDMTVPVIKHVLPGTILYDLLLCPFVLWLVAALVRRRAPERMTDARRTRVRVAPEYGALRLATAGAAPKLKLGGGSLAVPAAQRRELKLKLGGGSLAAPAAQRRELKLKLGGSPLTAPSVQRRKEPRLRLAGANSSFSSRTNRGGSSGSLSSSARRPVAVNFGTTGRDGLIGGGVLGTGLLSGSGLLSGPGLRRSGLRGPGLRRSALRGSTQRAAPQRKSPGKGWLKSAGTAGLARFSGSALARPAVPKFRRQGPASGWLKTGKRAAAPKFRSPGKGWLKSGRPVSSWQRRSPGKGWMRSSRRRKRMGGSR
ncbi:MAG TPA: rod shape-determining protein MreD [Trebonia sp.]|nr:rod shape-determining protein MreD [Trebonia sp.]